MAEYLLRSFAASSSMVRCAQHTCRPPGRAQRGRRRRDRRRQAVGDDVLGEAGPVARLPGDTKADRRLARKERFRLLVRRPGFLVGTVVLLFWIVCAVLGDRITPDDPINDFSTPNLSPGSGHWLGTDQFGRDVLSRVMAGSRDVLIVAPIAATLGVVFGTLLGLLMGYYRGWVDEVLSRILEVLLSIPVVLMALVDRHHPRFVTFGRDHDGGRAVHADRDPDGAGGGAGRGPARLRDVGAACGGEHGLFVMTREILPNITPTILVEYTVRIGYAVFTVATLSFLGAGIRPPSPDWGLAVADTYQLIQSGQWWIPIFPALAIATVVIATNLVADSIDAVMSA